MRRIEFEEINLSAFEGSVFMKSFTLRTLLYVTAVVAVLMVGFRTLQRNPRTDRYERLASKLPASTPVVEGSPWS